MKRAAAEAALETENWMKQMEAERGREKEVAATAIQPIRLLRKGLLKYWMWTFQS